MNLLVNSLNPSATATARTPQPKLVTSNSQLATRSSGFSLIEVTIVIAIITVLFGMAMPIYLQFQTRADVDSAVRTFVTAARRAQQLAQSSDSSSGWGVKYQAGTITVFRGATDSAGTITFATRTTSADETFVVPAAVTPSGTDEIDYTYLTGVVSSTPGTLTLTGSGSLARTVTSNAKGILTW